MPNRLAGILICLVLANVVNYALGEWLEAGIPRWVAEVKADGSTLATSMFYTQSSDTVLAADAGAEALLDYYAYLDTGGGSLYRRWQAAVAEVQTVHSAFLDRALNIAEAGNRAKYLSILLLVITLLLLYGGGLKENYWFAPLLYLGIYVGTVALYGALLSPLLTAIVAGLLAIYYVSVRLCFPIYHAEWTRMMRPGVSACIVLLAVMSVRGPELVDYWFWTSPLFRLLLVTVGLWALFFHLSIVGSVLKAAKMDTLSRVFAYAMPLGIVASVLGLFLGLYGSAPNAALVQLNAELVVVPPATVTGLPPNALFALFFAGVALLIVGGIGYFIRRILR